MLHQDKDILMVTGVADCNTPDKLAERIGEFVQWATWNASVPKLRTINRRFGPKASKLGVTVRDLVIKLKAAGVVITHDDGATTVVICKQFADMQAESYADDPLALSAAIERKVKDAQ